MLSAPARSRTPLSIWQVCGLALLATSAFLNYADRTVLSVGASSIQRELHLSSYQLGMLLSAFFWTYAAGQFSGLAGWLVDRFPVSRVFAAGFLLWSGAMAFTGLAQVFAVLFSLRLLLGLGESIAYPAYSRILANHFPEQHRGLANAVIEAGAKTGPALGTLVGGLLMVRYGWRAFFLAQGFISLLWLVPWLYWAPGSGAAFARQEDPDAPRIVDILRQSSAWFTAGGLFCANYFMYFLVTWLPSYLETERHFGRSKTAVFSALPFLAVAISAVISGWLSDRWIASGATPTRVRKTFAGCGLAFCTAILPAAIVRSEVSAVVLIVLACLSYGMYNANIFAITQTLAGPKAAGKWAGLQNGIGNLAGVVAPWVTGWVVQTTGQFYLAFVAAAVVVLAGAAMYVFGIGRIEPVRFGERGIQKRWQE